MECISGLSPACYFVLQPGDGTRYTVMTMDSHGDDGIYIAIGAGDVICGGYFLPKKEAIALLDDLYRHEGDEHLTAFAIGHHVTDYWRSHITTDLTRWTAAVAVLVASVLTYRSLDVAIKEDLFRVIAAVYRNKPDEVKVALREIIA